MVLTNADESGDAHAALVMPGKETEAIAPGTGERGITLPKAFSNDELIITQAKDQDCLRYMQLVNKPRAQRPPHLAVAVPSSYYPQTFDSESYTRTTSAITGDTLGWPRHSRA